MVILVDVVVGCVIYLKKIFLDQFVMNFEPKLLSLRKKFLLKPFKILLHLCNFFISALWIKVVVLVRNGFVKIS